MNAGKLSVYDGVHQIVRPSREKRKLRKLEKRVGALKERV